MATAFPQALGNQGGASQSPDAMQLLMQELQNPVKVNSGPMFSPEEVKRRVDQNNQLIQLGLLGQMSGDDRVSKVGGSVFKQSLADRDERQTDKGIQDPLTGETKIDPQYAAGLERTRRGQVLQQALQYQQKQSDASDRADRAKQDRQSREDMATQHNETMRAIAGARAGAASHGKAPPGYRFTDDGNMEPIPGGPAALKLQSAENKNIATEDMVIGNVERVVNAANDVKKNTNWKTAGMVGHYAGIVPGSDAYNMRRTVDMIKANLGFNELSAMRQASPTGGALGNISNQEIKYLQATIANLDPDQSAEQLSANIDKIVTHYTNWKNVVMQHRQERSQSLGYVPPSQGGTPPGAQPVVPGTPIAQPAGPSPQRLRLNPQTGKLEPF